MTEKELALYLKRISSQLKGVYNQIVEELPESVPKFEYKKYQYTDEINKKRQEWSIAHPHVFAGLIAYPPELSREEDKKEVIEFGKFIALDSLDRFIDELDSDIDILCLDGERSDG